MRFGPANIKRSECLKSWVREGVVQGWRRQLLANVRGGRGLYGDVAHINLVQRHAKTVSIAYIYDIAITHSYHDIGPIHSFIYHREHWLRPYSERLMFKLFKHHSH